MNLFNFLRFQNIEKKANDEDVLFRLAQRKNGKFVLVNDKGKIVSEECDWISKQIDNIRLLEKDGIVSYFSKEDGLAKSNTLSRDVKSETKPAVYASADDNGVNQVFITGKGTFIFTDDKNVSDLYTKLLDTNKNGVRLAYSKDGVKIVSKDACTVYEKYDSVSEPDENGVRIAKRSESRNHGWGPYSKDEIPKGSLIYILEGLAEKDAQIDTFYALLPENFHSKNEQYTAIKKFENDNYLVTLQNGKQEILNKRGNDIAGGAYQKIQEVNALGEVIANRTKSKSKGGIVLIHQGKRFKKVDDMHSVMDSAPIGIKALKYGPDLNKNVVAGVDISKGIEIDEDVNRVLIALLKGEKAQPKFWNRIEEQNKFDELAKGIDAYSKTLDEIASAKPELDIEIAMKKQNLVKSLQTLINRKIAGHKTYEKTEGKKIAKHEENISSSTSKRNKLESLEGFEQEK